MEFSVHPPLLEQRKRFRFITQDHDKVRRRGIFYRDEISSSSSQGFLGLTLPTNTITFWAKQITNIPARMAFISFILVNNLLSFSNKTPILRKYRKNMFAVRVPKIISQGTRGEFSDTFTPSIIFTRFDFSRL